MKNKEYYRYKFCNCELSYGEEIVSQNEPDYGYKNVIYYHCDKCGEDFAVLDFETEEILYLNDGYNKQ